MRSPLRAGLAIASIAAAALSCDWFRVAAQRHFAATQSYEDVYYLPPSDYLRLGSLGYQSALADLIWMKALVYYGEELGHHGNVKHLFRYADAMLALDPDFKRVYRWVASSAIYRTGEVTADDVRMAIRYLERGAHRFPDDGELAWDLGANYAFELAPLLGSGEERDRARRKGLDHLEAAVLRGAGPPWLVLQTAGQFEALGRKEQAIKHLEDVYATASDPTVKHEIELRLERLRSAAYLDALRRTSAELEQARARDYPYLTTSLYLLVGRRPPFEGDAFILDGFDPAPRRAAEPEQLSR